MSRTINYEHDKQFGPFTLSRWPKKLGIEFSSGYEEESKAENTLSIWAFGYILRLYLPHIIGHAGKWQESPREYGFYFYALEHKFYDQFTILYGEQERSEGRDRRWTWYFPWLQMKIVRCSLYTISGELFYQENHHWFTGREISRHRDWWDKLEELEKTVMYVKDYDGEVVQVQTHTEEREWHRGERWWFWLKYFCKPFIRRVIDIRFDRETGRRKRDSWKGGTIGTSIDLMPDENHLSAMERYCEINGMEFIGMNMPKDFVPIVKKPPAPQTDEQEANSRIAKSDG